MIRYLSFIILFFANVVTSKAQQTVGLFDFHPDAYEGYTLFGALQNTGTYLIDNCGNLINSWDSDLTPGSVVYLLEDGSLLRAERLPLQGFNGGGRGGRVHRMDWEGNTMWLYDIADDTQRQHHDIEYLPNGNILVLVWELRTADEAIAEGRNPQFIGSEFWSEKILELEPLGMNEANIVWEWYIWDHLIQDFDDTKNNYGVVGDHPELVDINYTGLGLANSNVDWIHFNSIDYNEELDQILLSSRHFQEVWIIDHSTTTEEAAGHSGGNSGKGGDLLYRWGNPRVYDRGGDFDRRLFFQHDASWIPEGHPNAGKIMIFNNGLGRPGGTYSSVDIIEPPMDEEGNYLLEEGEGYGPLEASWTYVAPTPNAFYSLNISGAQRLPNGNTLICEGNEGRIFEVKLDGTLLWEYINPVNSAGIVTQGQNNGSNNVFRAYRYGLNYPGFEGKDLTPGEPIELEPLPTDCMLTDIDEVVYSTTVIFPNPVKEWLFLERSENKDCRIQLISLTGQIIKDINWKDYEKQLYLGDLISGIYFLKIGNETPRKIMLAP